MTQPLKAKKFLAVDGLETTPGTAMELALQLDPKLDNQRDVLLTEAVRRHYEPTTKFNAAVVDEGVKLVVSTNSLSTALCTNDLSLDMTEPFFISQCQP